MNTVIAIASFIYLIPFVLGLSKYPILTKTEKNFFFFMVASAICSGVAYFYATVGNNIFILYLFNFLEIILLPLFLLDNKDRLKFKWVWVIATLVGAGLIFFEALYREGGVLRVNNISLSYAALLLSILSIRMLLKLRFDPNIYDLSKSSLFWFTLGLGVYYLGNILIFAFLRVFQIEDMQTLTNLAYFRILLVYLSVILYTWGFVIIKTNSGTPVTGKS